ncbi:MAG: phage holin family protein [Clostridia bacterium]|nr:phage holin family protein [Clostridia bacterium]
MGKLTLKLSAVLAGSLLDFLLGGLNQWLLMLCILMTVDYLTGVAAAYTQGNLCSSRGIAGIFKKAGYIAAVFVGYCLDFCAAEAGVTLPHGAFGLSVTFWLIATELLSVTENLGSLGVPLPHFLLRALSLFKEEQDDRHDETHL